MMNLEYSFVLLVLSNYFSQPLFISQVGDGTTSVVLLAGEILKNCKGFIEENVHPQVIVRGLRKATHLATQKIKEMAVKVKIDDPV